MFYRGVLGCGVVVPLSIGLVRQGFEGSSHQFTHIKGIVIKDANLLHTSRAALLVFHRFETAPSTST